MTTKANVIYEELKKQFPDYAVELSGKDEKGKISITAARDWKNGFEVDMTEGSDEADISFSSKIRTITNLSALGLTALLTWLLGGKILVAFGMFTDVGGVNLTLKLLYVIPMLIFLFPSLIVASIFAGIINPSDKALLEQVKTIVDRIRQTA